MDRISEASVICSEAHAKMERLAFGGSISEGEAEEIHEAMMQRYRSAVIEYIENRNIKPADGKTKA